MDFLYQLPITRLRTDHGPLPAAGIIIHPEPELRALYARQLRRCLVDVESAASLNDIKSLLAIMQPQIIIIEASLVFPLGGQRIIRRLWESYPHIALATLGNASDSTLPPGVAGGIRAHISSKTTRIGAISEMVRELLK